MKRKTYATALICLLALFGVNRLNSQAEVTYPIVGTTTFSQSTTTVLANPGPCAPSKTASAVGWSMSVSSSSDCAISWEDNTSGGDGHISLSADPAGYQWQEATFGSVDGSEFSLSNLSFATNSSTMLYSFTFVGYKNGVAVQGATLSSSALTATGIANAVSVSFTSNPAFNDLDEFKILAGNASAQGDLLVLRIGVGTPTVAVACTTPTLSLSSSLNVACKGASTGAATMIATGDAPFTYTWAPVGGNAAIASGLTAGIYTCVTTNSCGLTATQTVAITEPATALTASTTAINVLCNGGNSGSATLTASGGTGAYTYSWSTGATSSVIINQTAGVKNYTVMDANNCVSTGSVSIAQPTAALSTSINISANSICEGSTATLTAGAAGGSGTLNYTWVSGPTSTLFVVSPTTTSVYTLNVTDGNNCSTSSSITITVNALPTIGVNSGSICSGQNFTIVPTGAAGGTYTISGGSSIVSPTTTTTYSVIGTSSLGCVGSNTANATITVVALPVLSVAATSATICAGANATLTASGASSYTWLPSASHSASISVLPSSSTTYSVSGSNTAGCVSNVATTSLGVLPMPSVAAAGSTLCPGNVYTLSPSGAVSYTLTNATNTLSGTSVTLAPLTNVIYTVSGTDANGCVSSGSNNAVVELTVAPVPSLTVAATPTSVCSGGASSLTISGANTYTWASPASNATQVVVTPSATTVYTVSGTGTNVCNAVKLFTLTVFATPTITINNGTICSGYNFTLTPGGAGAGATYTLSDASGTITAIVSPTATTNYSVVGTTSAGCVSNISTPTTNTIVVKASPVISALSGSVCAGQTFSSLPSGANTYSINGVATTTNGAVLPTVNTSYTVTGTGTNNCVSPLAAVFSVTVGALPTVSVSATPTAICVGQGTAVLTANGANTYSWSNGASSNASVAVSPLANTVYSVVGTATNGCSSTKTLAVIVNTLPVLYTTSTSTLICVGGNNVLSVSGANTYTWSDGTNGSSTIVNPTVTTNYSVAGTNSVGCVGINAITVVVNTLVVNLPSSSTICPGTSKALTATGAVSYTWNGTYPFSTFTVTPIANSVYTLVATDANSCIHVGTVAVNLYPQPNVTATMSHTRICAHESATLTGHGATNYIWNNIPGSATLVVTPDVDVVYTYSLQGTDANNCVGSTHVSLIVNACTGLEKIAASKTNVSVYPNPSQGEIHVLLNEVTEDQSLEVYDALGRLVHIAQISDTTTTLKLDNQAKGIYSLRIIEKGSVVSQKRIILQ
jgi:hypothetical protein